MRKGEEEKKREMKMKGDGGRCLETEEEVWRCEEGRRREMKMKGDGGRIEYVCPCYLHTFMYANSLETWHNIVKLHIT